jgi:hypothetical protein
MRQRTWLFPAVVGAFLTVVSSASAQALGGVVQTVGTVTAPVTQTVQTTVASAAQTVGPATQPVTQAVAPVTKPVTQTVSGVANTVRGVERTAPAAPTPVTDAVSGATGGGSGDSSAGGGAGSGTSPGQNTVARSTEKCPRGSKQAGGGGGNGQAGGGGGGGSSIFLTAAAAERAASMQREVQSTKQRPAGGDTTDQLAKAGGVERDDRGDFLVPGFPNPDEYPASVGLALLGLLALGFVGIIAGATSHVLARVRSS